MRKYQSVGWKAQETALPVRQLVVRAQEIDREYSDGDGYSKMIVELGDLVRKICVAA